MEKKALLITSIAEVEPEYLYLYFVYANHSQLPVVEKNILLSYGLVEDDYFLLTSPFIKLKNFLSILESIYDVIYSEQARKQIDRLSDVKKVYYRHNSDNNTFVAYPEEDVWKK